MDHTAIHLIGKKTNRWIPDVHSLTLDHFDEQRKIHLYKKLKHTNVKVSNDGPKNINFNCIMHYKK